jgi:tRNA-specific 2-thiouridylase
MNKTDVRKVAAELGLPVADKPESQEICFVPDNNHAAYIRKRGSTGPGQIVDKSGQHIGHHQGLEQYTPGQRRGLDLGGGTSPRYVISLDKNENRITVGSKADAYAKSIELRNVHWVSSTPPAKSSAVEVRTRYRMPVEPAIISDVAGKTTVSFLNQAWAPAPGQAAVLYTGEEVLGGGTIDKVVRR